MSPDTQSTTIFTQIGFQSPEPTDRLKIIELFGVPGEKTNTGTITVGEKTQYFFDDLIVKPIFQKSRLITNCPFQTLKIWLYDLDTPDNDQGYVIPKLDEHDLEIRSHNRTSQLECIYVLDNGLEADTYLYWQSTAEHLFTPLFDKFSAFPQQTTQRRGRYPLTQALSHMRNRVESMVDALDPHHKMKQNLFFNALIIQID